MDLYIHFQDNATCTFATMSFSCIFHRIKNEPGHAMTVVRSDTWYDIIDHASQVDRKTTIKIAVLGYATRDGHMTWSRDGHMTKVPDCSKLKNNNIIKDKKQICCHIGCLFNLTCIFNLWCKNKFTNILKQQKKSVVKIGGIGVSDRKSSQSPV